jgi:AraC-like DNA-binding protein
LKCPILSTKNTLERAATSADYVKSLIKIARSANISLLNILKELSLPMEILEEKAPLNLVDFFRIQELISIEIRDESLLMSSRPLLLGTTDHVLASLQGKETIADAIKQLATSYNFIHSGKYNRVELRNTHLVYIIDDALFPYAPQSDAKQIAFNMENVLIFVHSIISSLLNVPIGNFIKKVQYKAYRTNTEFEQKIFNNACIQTDSKTYALFYDISIINESLSWVNEKPLTSQHVYSEIQKLVSVQNQESIKVNCFKSRVIELLESGVLQQDKVACKLCCSIATLRRNLNQQNTSFRKLKGMVLNKEAKFLLSQHLSLIDIAEVLGFSDVRSFIRAFKQWSGITPTEYMKLLL